MIGFSHTPVEEEQIKQYARMLQLVGSLSDLFADSAVPYLNYRVVENAFCQSFQARNLSRSDCSFDAEKNGIGIGIKTFLEKNGSTLQKIAEFNSEHYKYRDLSNFKAIKIISEIRNDRIRATGSIFGTQKSIYHTVARNEHGLRIFEIPMENIQIENIRSKNIKSKGNILQFSDGQNEYSFNLSKSTLYKRFFTPAHFFEIPIDIIKDPFLKLNMLFPVTKAEVIKSFTAEDFKKIILPLYSEKSKRFYIPELSGLNQWNGNGRNRDQDEVYIRIPSWIHTYHPSFFPDRGTEFSLALSNGKIELAKVCQGGDKALMTNPNKALGNWILRDILRLKPGVLCSYEDLIRIGVDSVCVTKNSEKDFSLDFRPIGTYETFKNREF